MGWVRLGCFGLIWARLACVGLIWVGFIFWLGSIMLEWFGPGCVGFN